MQSLIKSIFLTLIFSSYSLAIEPGKVTGGERYDIPSWFTDSFLDISDDVEEASDEDKKVLLFFHLDGCPYCNAMVNQNFSSGSNKSFIQENFSVIAVNIKGNREITMPDGDAIEEKDLAKLLGIKYTPTILFLDKSGKQIFRTNGYRNPKTFGHTLSYIADNHYIEKTLNEHILKEQSAVYDFRDHSLLTQVDNFSKINTPVLMLFEDQGCTGCDYIHQKLLNLETVKEELKKFTFVRVDGNSDKPFIFFDGKEITPRELASKYDLSFRPGFLLFDEGNKIIEIDNRLYSFHFNTVLNYVSGKHYKEFDTFNDYRRARQVELLEKGVNINLVD